MIHVAFPMDHLAIDTAKLNPTEDGFNNLLIVVDICTQFAWLYPMRSCTGEETVDNLFRLVTHFSIPHVIQSDNGPEFVNAAVSHLLCKLGMDHCKITPYKPQSNGAAKQLVCTIKTSLLAQIKHGTV